ncbi:hypothetical protein PIB30_018326 [Stylosanthes scabra]|uniref:Uncharacterized protein n=1 Tax=Stylosanthes scabra TaxID=79078 RepID=A0ABU6Z5C9_9FABA|nr:hypothetical protein [Stylosanthes scabra]
MHAASKFILNVPGSGGIHELMLVLPLGGLWDAVLIEEPERMNSVKACWALSINDSWLDCSPSKRSLFLPCQILSKQVRNKPPPSFPILSRIPTIQFLRLVSASASVLRVKEEMNQNFLAQLQSLNRLLFVGRDLFRSLQVVKPRLSAIPVSDGNVWTALLLCF